MPPTKPLEPAIGLILAKIKAGKTSDLLYAFGEDCVYIARPGALSPSIGLVGRPIPPARIVRATNLDGITKVLAKVAGKVRAVITDDLTPIAAEHVRDYMKKRNGKPRLKGWKLWGRVREDFLGLRAAAMDCTAGGTHVWFTTHERQPRMNERTGFVLGGPDLPGRMQEDFSAACDYVLRARYDQNRPGWPYSYHGGPSSTWGLSDRNHVVGGVAPMNIAEIMRAANFDLPRGKGLEWMEPIVVDLCGDLVERGRAFEDVAERVAAERVRLKELIPGLVDAHGPHAARWILRDAADRAALLRRGPLEQLSGFWVEPEADASPEDGVRSGSGMSDEVEEEAAEDAAGGKADANAVELGGEVTGDSVRPAAPDDAPALE